MFAKLSLFGSMRRLQVLVLAFPHTRSFQPVHEVHILLFLPQFVKFHQLRVFLIVYFPRFIPSRKENLDVIGGGGLFIFVVCEVVGSKFVRAGRARQNSFGCVRILNGLQSFCSMCSSFVNKLKYCMFNLMSKKNLKCMRNNTIRGLWTMVYNNLHQKNIYIISLFFI